MASRNAREETSSDFVESFRTTGLESASPDWRDTKSASQCLDHLCLSKHLSDVTLRFSKEPSVKLPAHKFVLSMRSKVFEAMFYENKGLPDSTVTIDDVGSETMRILIRFMYTDKSDIDGKNVLKCLQAARQYAIAGLEANCSTFLEKQISARNVCTIHEQAIYYKKKELQTKCFEFMVENASDIFKSDGFRRISQATLVNLLKSDNLDEDEENIFTAASAWAEAQCSSNKMDVTPDNKRRCLGEALNEIRFPIMSIENFATFVTPAGILTSDEQVMLYQYLASNGTTPLNRFMARERGGDVVISDMEKYWCQQVFPGASGYQLSISTPRQKGYASNCGAKMVTLKTVTGTFAGKVKRISNFNNPGNSYDFKVKEDKIIFHPPLHIVDECNLVFETNERNDTLQYFDVFRQANAVSYHVNCLTNVNGKVVNITTVPEGLVRLSFAK